MSRLPMESEFRTEMRDRYSDEELAEMSELAGDDVPHGAWSKTDSLLAAVLDALTVLINVQLGRAGVETQPLEPVRRPGVVSTRRKANPQQFAYLERIRLQHAQEADSEMEAQ